MRVGAKEGRESLRIVDAKGGWVASVNMKSKNIALEYFSHIRNLGKVSSACVTSEIRILQF